MFKRIRHTATAIPVSSTRVVVVVVGGVEEWVRDGRADSQQSMRADTCVLEFGNYFHYYLGAHNIVVTSIPNN